MSIASLKSAIVAGVVAASTAPAALASQIFINYPFQGVRHIHRIESDPQWDMHIIEIDLKAPGIRFRFTEPNGPDVPGELTLETTRAYLNRVGAQIAINAGSYFINPQYPYADNYYLGVSDGVRYSPFTYGESAINISQDNVATIIEQDPADRNQGIPSYNSVPKVDLYNAIGGKERIITNGINVAGTTEGCNQSDDCHNRHPRTAIGVTADQKLLLFTVDGRQPGHSVGMTTPEVADILLEYGAVDAINLDGGGSTTLVMSQDVAARD
ncbi:MAG TPA: phosphodiester glycosidase family protein, partial [Phycisphaeraceae bacterium]